MDVVLTCITTIQSEERLYCNCLQYKNHQGFLEYLVCSRPVAALSSVPGAASLIQVGGMATATAPYNRLAFVKELRPIEITD